MTPARSTSGSPEAIGGDGHQYEHGGVAYTATMNTVVRGGERENTVSHRDKFLLRAARTLGGVTDVVTQTQTESALVDQACDIIVGEGGYRLAWIGLARHDDVSTVEPVAHAGYEDGYLESLDIKWSDTERGRGPTGTAIRTGHPSIAQNIAHLPEFKPWRADAHKRGYASSVALPMRANGEILGALNIYAGEPDAFDELEVAVLERLAANVSHGIHALRLRDERIRVGASERRKTELLRAIYEACPDMIFVHGPDGRLLEVSDAVVETYGVSPEEMKAADPARFMGENHDVRDALQRIGRAQQGDDVDFEWTARKADLTEFPVEVRLRQLKGPGSVDDNARVLAWVRDLTEAKRAEKLHLENEKTRSLGLLAGGIAHDFNNLLMAIVSNIELAVDRVVEPEVREILDDAERAALRAAGLTGQLLTFARGGSPMRRLLHPETLFTEDVQFALRGTSVAVDFSFCEDVSCIEADEGQVSQVIHNLALNAAQAMPNGGVLQVSAVNTVIELSNSLQLSPGRYVRVTVQDDGPGIDADVIDQVFDPYFTTRSAGNGLGLATSRSIMRGHDGDIELTSAPGDGARFDLFFPASDEQVTAEADVQVVASEGRGARVLLMDDEEAVLSVLQRILVSMSYEVQATPNGEAAIAAFQAAQAAGRPFDVAVLDLTVQGGMGGVETINALLAIDPGLLAIASSGYANNDVFADCSTFGFSGALRKPYTSQALAAELNRVLASR